MKLRAGMEMIAMTAQFLGMIGITAGLISEVEMLRHMGAGMTSADGDWLSLRRSSVWSYVSFFLSGVYLLIRGGRGDLPWLEASMAGVGVIVAIDFATVGNSSKRVSIWIRGLVLAGVALCFSAGLACAG